MPIDSKYLLFIDTNIFLDFYRSRKDTRLKLLNKLLPLNSQIVTTYQLEMEFFKNRQNVFTETLKYLKVPDAPVAPPAFLHESPTVESIRRYMATVRKKHNIFTKRIQAYLKNPKKDPVCKVVLQLCDKKSKFHLCKDMNHGKRIWRLAWTRFVGGYPPRKNNDTSIGDSVNWEWILCCAKEAKKSVVIVSNDQDYGLPDSQILNDWLFREFRERCGRKKSVFLTNSLIKAFELMSVHTTKEEKETEAEFATTSWGPFQGKLPPSYADLKLLTPVNPEWREIVNTVYKMPVEISPSMLDIYPHFLPEDKSKKTEKEDESGSGS